MGGTTGLRIATVVTVGTDEDPPYVGTGVGCVSVVWLHASESLAVHE